MKNFLFWFLFFCSANVVGQGRDQAKTYMNTTLQFEGIYLTGSDLSSSTGGSVYLFPKWEGKYEVYMSGENGYSFPNLNYNVKSKLLESKIAKDSVYQFDVEKVSLIKHDRKKYRVCKIHETKELFQEIYVSKNILFLKGFNVVLGEGTINPLTLEYIHQEGYHIKEKFYLKFNDEKFIELKLNKRSVLSQFSDKAPQIKKYASASKLSFNSERDLFKIFLYYDTL